MCQTMLPDMADYYSTIARAVSALKLNTSDARHQMYGRARAALAKQLRGATPPLGQSDILAAQMSLEDAIGRVEAEAQRERDANRPLAALSTARPREAATRPGGDTWLSEILARASRD